MYKYRSTILYLIKKKEKHVSVTLDHTHGYNYVGFAPRQKK